MSCTIWTVGCRLDGTPSAKHPRFRRTLLPTVAKIGPYRFFFFANENDEPPHIHVVRNRLLEAWNDFFGNAG